MPRSVSGGGRRIGGLVDAGGLAAGGGSVLANRWCGRMIVMDALEVGGGSTVAVGEVLVHGTRDASGRLHSMY